MVKHLAFAALWTLSLLACHDSAVDTALPEIVASSKYIDYSPYADASVLCMDDTLAAEDRFIEEVAAFLGVGTPSGRIRFIWDPRQKLGNMQTWACEGIASSCYVYDEAKDLGLIRSVGFVEYHELVHAVDIPVLGEGHRTLVEGLAEYLGSSQSTEDILKGFPEAFKAMVARAPQPDDYRLAMHFVGSILRDHGVDRYKSLRKELAADGDLEAFETTFEAVYGETLSAALIAMSEVAIQGKIQDTCVTGGQEELNWTSPGLLETTLRGECGDPTFIGPGFADSRDGFVKSYIVEITEAGFYDLTVTGPGLPSEQPSYSMRPCPGVETGVESAGGGLYPGRYELGVGFPAGPEARGEAAMRLELVVPF